MIGGKNTDHGKADVYIDDGSTPDATIDTYASTWNKQVSLYTKSNLSYALHTIKIVIHSADDRNPNSTYNTTDIDGFIYGNPG